MFFLQWAFGVTCWEVFNGGKNPYPGMNPYTVAQMIDSGERLQKPINTACSEEMYVRQNLDLLTMLTASYIATWIASCSKIQLTQMTQLHEPARLETKTLPSSLPS